MLHTLSTACSSNVFVMSSSPDRVEVADAALDLAEPATWGTKSCKKLCRHSRPLEASVTESEGWVPLPTSSTNAAQTFPSFSPTNAAHCDWTFCGG